MSEQPRENSGPASERTLRQAARPVLARDELEALLGPGAGADHLEPNVSALRRTEEALAGLRQSTDEEAGEIRLRGFRLPELAREVAGNEAQRGELRSDQQHGLRIELGRTYLPLDDVRRLRHGSVVTFDGGADDPVAICVNDRVVALGELMVMQGKFCVRVLEVVGSALAKAG